MFRRALSNRLQMPLQSHPPSRYRVTFSVEGISLRTTEYALSAVTPILLSIFSSRTGASHHRSCVLEGRCTPGEILGVFRTRALRYCAPHAPLSDADPCTSSCPRRLCKDWEQEWRGPMRNQWKTSSQAVLQKTAGLDSLKHIKG